MNDTAWSWLSRNQRQLDMDGCEVGVSRQALDETLAELKRLQEAMQWQPIETAPQGNDRKKGPRILLWRKGLAFPVIGWWDPVGVGLWDSNDFEGRISFTHWMPLPQPPEGK